MSVDINELGWRLHYQHAKGQAQHKDFLTRAEADAAKAEMRVTYGCAEFVATITKKPSQETAIYRVRLGLALVSRRRTLGSNKVL